MPDPVLSSSEKEMEESSSQEKDETAFVPFQPIIHATKKTVEFSVDRIQSQLICRLCGGFFRGPFTTTNCHHTFCRGCLGIAFSAGNFDCSTCHTYLGKDIEKAGTFDHILNDLVEKVLFPQLAQEDVKRENEFYAHRGIDAKVLTSTPSPKKRRLQTFSSKMIIAELVPGPESSALKLEHPLIYSESTLRIGQIKKYLTQMFFANTNIPAPTKWRISCHETPLGDELNLMFVVRTVWRESEKMLQLVYTEENVC